MIENVFTLKEVEVIFDRPTKYIKYLFKIKRLDFFRDNGRIRVNQSSVEKYSEFLKKQMAAKLK